MPRLDGLLLLLYALLLISPHLLTSPKRLAALMAQIKEQPGLRRTNLIRSLRSTWLLALCGTVMLGLFKGLAAAGIRVPNWHPAVWLVLVGALLFYAYQLHRARTQPQVAERVRAMLIRTSGWALPTVKEESLPSLLVLLSAGVTEEILFRGFLLWSLLLTFPGIDPSLGVTIVAVLFGLAHRASGWYSVGNAWVLGMIFGHLFLLDGSLLAPILLHMMHNGYCFLLWRVVRGEGGASLGQVG